MFGKIIQLIGIILQIKQLEAQNAIAATID